MKEQENGMDVIKIRYNDKCKRCQVPLTVKGIAERKDKCYKLLLYCEKCGEILTFERVDRRKVEGGEEV